MAWKLTVDGTDHTEDIHIESPVRIELSLNERSRAEFRTLWTTGYVPDRWSEVVMYAQDGMTPIFGGLVKTRRVQRRGSARRFADVSCVDFFAYLDWAYVTFSYDAPVTLKTVLTEIISQLPGAYGISVDGTQADGPTLQPYSVTRMKASDAIRDLTQRSGATPNEQHVARMSPLKAILMLVPGSESAPFVMNDANPHCLEFEWQDTDLDPINTVILAVGTAGVQVTQHWVVAGGATTFVTDFPATNVVPIGVVRVTTGAGAFDATVSGPGEGGMFEWDQSTHTLSAVSVPGGLSNGDTLDFNYLPDFPATVIATSGGTPERQALYEAPDESSLASAQEMADGLIATLDQEPRQAQALSRDHGWLPAQLLTVDLSLADVDTVFLIASVEISLTSDAIWDYTITGSEDTIYQGTHVTRWREKFAGSASGSAGFVSGGGSGGGITTVLAAPFPMGGSDQASQPAGANAWADVVNANDFYATADQTVTIRAWLWSRVNSTDVQAALYCIDDNVNVATSSIIAAGTSRPTDPLVFVAAVEAGKRYRLRQRSHTAGVSPYAIGQLAA